MFLIISGITPILDIYSQSPARVSSSTPQPTPRLNTKALPQNHTLASPAKPVACHPAPARLSPSSSRIREFFHPSHNLLSFLTHTLVLTSNIHLTFSHLHSFNTTTPTINKPHPQLSHLTTFKVINTNQTQDAILRRRPCCPRGLCLRWIHQRHCCLHH